MAENWLLNPQRIGKGNSMNPRRRKGRRRMTAKQRRYFGENPRRKRKRSKRRVTTLRRHRTYRVNPSRRRRRSYSGNPPAIRSIAGDLGWSAAGFMTTKVVGNMITPMITGMVGDQPIFRIAVKLGVAYISAWGLSSFMGSRVFMPAMIGGSLEAVQDAVKTFIAPTFPMLAANYEPLQMYYEPRAMMPAVRGARRGMAEYYGMGDGLSPDHDAVV